MKKLQANQTTAENLEAKFDRGDEVLDYFEAGEARVVVPESGSVSQRGAHRRIAVAETPPPYKKKR